MIAVPLHGPLHFSFPQSPPLPVVFSILCCNIKRKVNSFLSALDMLGTNLEHDYAEGSQAGRTSVIVSRKYTYTSLEIRRKLDRECCYMF